MTCAAVQAVLAEPAYREAATRFRRDATGLPGSAHAVTLLERLAAERRPILEE